MSSLTRFFSALAATLMLGLMFFGAQPTVQAQSTTLVISELRTRGPGTTGLANGTGNDDFVEITNVSGGSLDISGYKLRGSNAAGTIGDRATVPAATVLPPGGHYLFANSTAGGYSLGSYPAGVGTTATADSPFATGITDDGGVAITLADNTILDQVGMSAAVAAAFREGTPLAQTAGTGTNQFSYVRRTAANGLPQDTNNNAADFVLVATSGTANGITAVLGAPGPENRTSPVQRNAAIKASLIDSSVSSAASPNRVRSGQVVTNGAFGTLSIQRRFTNTTPDPITRLRFRIIDITTLNSPVVAAPQADLRVLSSTGTVTNSQGATVATVTGLTLEEPPTQALGGGLNSSLTVIPPNGSLASGSAIDVQFLLGVQAEGNFRFLVNVEALPATSTTPALTGAASATKAGAATRTRVSNK
jgi:Lamin Tail Domain